MSDIEFKQSKICCISDIHLGVHQNNSSWHKILLDWAQWLNQQLEKNKIQDIMICGDLFHYRDEIAVNSLHVANEFFDILHQYNIVMITGNHDCYYKDNSLVNSLSILKGRPNITIIDQCYSTTIFDKHVTFCPWGTKINEIKIKKGWVLFDPHKGIYFSNKMGEWATIEEINNQNWKLEKLSPTEISESFYKPYLDKLPNIDNIGLNRANTQSPINRLLLAIQQIGF